MLGGSPAAADRDVASGGSYHYVSNSLSSAIHSSEAQAVQRFCRNDDREDHLNSPAQLI